MVNTQLQQALYWYNHYKKELAPFCDDDQVLDEALAKASNLYDLLLEMERERIQCDERALGLKRIIDNNKRRLQRFENRSEKIKAIILETMVANEIPRVDAPDITLSVRKGQKSVCIIDETLIPVSYKKTTTIVDKAALKNALKNGEVIDGASLIDGGAILNSKRT